MSYIPEPTSVDRELGKISAEFASQATVLAVHSDAIADMLQRIKELEERAVVPPAPSDVLWRWDATSILPFGIHAKSPSRVTLVQAGGRNAVRLLTLPGDNNVNGSGAWERCDLRLSNELTAAQEGVAQRWTHSVMLPDDYADLPQSVPGGQWHDSVLMDFHNTADKGGQANAQLMAGPPTAPFQDWPTGLHFRIHGGDPAKPTVGEYKIGPIVRNVWLEFVHEMLWTSTARGYYRVWMNDNLVVSHVGPTLYTGEGAYLKLANYHSPHGKPSSVLHARVNLERG